MRRPWVLPALAIALACAAGCGRKPTNVTLTITPEAIVLIEDGQEICARMGRTGIERFRAAEAEEQQAKRRAEDTDRLRLAQAILQSQEAPPPADGAEPAPTPSAPAVPQPVPARQRFEEFLESEAAPDFAAADRADELAARLLPQVRGEAPAETEQAVRDLLQAGREVCRAARSADSADHLRGGLEAALKSWNGARGKLAALYTVSDVDAQFARHKYGPLLEEARSGAEPSPEEDRLATMSPEERARQRREWDAVQQRQERNLAEHQDAVSRWRQQGAEAAAGPMPRLKVKPVPGSKPAADPEALLPRMKSWQLTYSSRSAPVRSALSRYLAERGRVGENVQPICKEMLAATRSLQADPAALEAPDEAVAHDLKAAYQELEELANACSTGQTAESNFRLGSFERAIQKAVGTMFPYGMKP